MIRNQKKLWIIVSSITRKSSGSASITQTFMIRKALCNSSKWLHPSNLLVRKMGQNRILNSDCSKFVPFQPRVNLLYQCKFRPLFSFTGTSPVVYIQVYSCSVTVVSGLVSVWIGDLVFKLWKSKFKLTHCQYLAWIMIRSNQFGSVPYWLPIGKSSLSSVFQDTT